MLPYDSNSRHIFHRQQNSCVADGKKEVNKNTINHRQGIYYIPPYCANKNWIIQRKIDVIKYNEAGL